MNRTSGLSTDFSTLANGQTLAENSRMCKQVGLRAYIFVSYAFT